MSKVTHKRSAYTAIMCAATLLASAGGARSGWALQRHAAVPEAAVLIVYLPQEPLYAPQTASGLLKPYEKQIKKLPVRDAMLSSVGNAAVSVKWILKSVVGKYQNGPQGMQADPGQVAQLMSDGRTDSVVLLQIYAQLTEGLKGLMVAAVIDIAEKTLQGPIEIKHREITATVSIANAGAPLSRKERASINASGAQARARIWFANEDERAKTAVILDLIEFEKQLRSALASPVEN